MHRRTRIEDTSGLRESLIQVRSLLRGGDSRRSWCLHAKARPLPAGYLTGFAAAVGASIALPYGEELLRCARAQAARRPGGIR
ncbi:hypothetical protein [Streptomyces sp. FH025]|uniref:hypothetical protein n=1 Tax=Streptomyces sp. FH025 TaxID=2815937 RepID=UPI001FAE83E0|nr:hypothetical protein [Streptomyces sp. FH025]